jgi:hypothetical protein
MQLVQKAILHLQLAANRAESRQGNSHSGNPRKNPPNHLIPFATLKIETPPSRGTGTQKPPLRWLFHFQNTVPTLAFEMSYQPSTNPVVSDNGANPAARAAGAPAWMADPNFNRWTYLQLTPLERHFYAPYTSYPLHSAALVPCSTAP